ncbi:MAG: thiol reductase thioredoxin [Phycisphaerales bacterium]|nr:MAG: thiol reductase thioredoxin [Phycisphaerales bacterium]
MTTTTPPMTLNAQFLKSKFEAGLTYPEYLKTDPSKAESWQKIFDQIKLTPEQTKLIGGFVREMPVVVSTGIWCGDCVQQLPLLQKIAEANPVIKVRYLDRDQHSDLAEQIKICGGMRVPVAIFLAEDFEPVSIFGDRTLTRYRALASKQLGASCPLPGAPVPQDELNATLQDWLDEVERVQLLLRLSGRLREKHGD